MRRVGRVLAVALLVGIATGGGAVGAHADDETSVTFDATTVTVEYGEYWMLTATAVNTFFVQNPWVTTGTLSGTPSGYVPSVFGYQSLPQTTVAYVEPAESGRPLPTGTYTSTVTVTASNGAGDAYTTAAPATLTITPAALTTTLSVLADPSNPANAIISSELTGPFRDHFFTSTYPEGPLSPAGTWHITATDESGEVVHELTKDRADTDDVMGVSSYWSDIPPGTYTVQATFTPNGASADNFAVTAPAPVTFAAAPAPGATSTATPAPPAPAASSAESGLTLPGWIPLIAGVLSAGLLALVIVQIVRLRRIAVPKGSEG